MPSFTLVGWSKPLDFQQFAALTAAQPACFRCLANASFWMRSQFRRSEGGKCQAMRSGSRESSADPDRNSLTPPDRVALGNRSAAAAAYQTRQEFTGYMGWPFLQPKALPKASKFCTVPLTRQWPGECGSMSDNCRAICSVWFWHHTWAKPMK